MSFFSFFFSFFFHLKIWLMLLSVFVGNQARAVVIFS